MSPTRAPKTMVQAAENPRMTIRRPSAATIQQAVSGGGLLRHADHGVEDQGCGSRFDADENHFDVPIVLKAFEKRKDEDYRDEGREHCAEDCRNCTHPPCSALSDENAHVDGHDSREAIGRG